MLRKTRKKARRKHDLEEQDAFVGHGGAELGVDDVLEILERAALANAAVSPTHTNRAPPHKQSAPTQTKRLLMLP